MKHIFAAVVITLFAGGALAQDRAAPTPASAPIVTKAYKKAPPAPKHKKAQVKKERSKKEPSKKAAAN